MNRLNYILKRVLQMIPVLFVVTILVFSIIRFIPGEPARLILGEKATEEAVAALTEKLGLNEPLLTQYFLFLKQIFTLDFGNSFTYSVPVAELLASTDRRVGDIAWECGFSDAGYFAKTFREMKGCTPGQYRASER